MIFFSKNLLQQSDVVFDSDPNISNFRCLGPSSGPKNILIFLRKITSGDFCANF